jgi:Leucine-rich repeat (LRR) protein
MKKHLFMFLPLAAIAFIAFSCDEPSKNTEEDSWTDDSPIITFKDPYFVDAIFDRDRIWEHEGIPSSIFGAFGKDEIPVDRNNDGQISEKEAMQVELLNISGGNKSTRAIGLTRAAKDVVYTGYRIRGIDEIKYFTNLTQLMCGGNDLTSIDVSNNL